MVVFVDTFDPDVGQPYNPRVLKRVVANAVKHGFVVATGDWAVSAGAGLDVNIAAGEGVVNGYYGKTTSSKNLSGLTASSTLQVYAEVVEDVNGNGTDMQFNFTSGSVPAGALPLAEITTSGGAVTGVTDRRKKGGNIRALLGADSVETSVVGVTATQVKDIDYVKDLSTFHATTIKVVVRVKASAGTGNIRFRNDGSGSDALLITTTSASYEIKFGSIDISKLADGRHTMEIYLDNSGGGNTTYLELLEIWGE